MAATISKVNDEGLDYAGSTPIGQFKFTGDAAYPAGGYAVTAAQFGLRILSGIIELANNTAAAGFVLSYNSQTGKVQVLESAGSAAALTEVSGDISTLSWTILVVGAR